MLTDEQKELCRRLREDLDVRDLDAIAAADLIELLAAHGAGAEEPVAYVGWGGEGKPKTLLIREDLPVGTARYAKPMTQGELPSCDVERHERASQGLE